MPKISWIALPVLAFSLACQRSKPVDLPLDFKDNPYMDAIYNSATADHPEDSSHLARMRFIDTAFVFDTIREGDTVQHAFRYVNEGNARLLLIDINTGCGCTVPRWPRGFIPPGDTGIVQVEFHSEGKAGDQEKEISAVTNGRPQKVSALLRGHVVPKKSAR